MKKRNVTIDLARLVFIFIIILNHANQLMQPEESIPVIMRFGYLGVEFFFIVSGYLMAMKAQRRQNKGTKIGDETVQFVLNKVGIIFPYYIVSYAVAFAAIHYFEAIGLKALGVNAILSIPTIMQLDMAGFNGYQAMSSTWYLSAMYLSMLLLYPLLLKFDDEFTKVIAPIIAIFGYGFLAFKNGHFAIIDPIQEGFVHGGLIRGLAGISLGCVCYELTNLVRRPRLTLISQFILCVLEVGAYAVAVILMMTQYTYRPDVIFVICIAVAITISFSNQSLLGRVLSLRNSSWLGKLATCLYLADSPARRIVCGLMPVQSFHDRFLPAVFGTFVLAIVIWGLGSFLEFVFRKCVSLARKTMVIT